MKEIRAGKLAPSSLPRIPPFFLCDDFIDGFCRRGDDCNKSHEICIVPTGKSAMSVTLEKLMPNHLSMHPRGQGQNKVLFDDDGPGELSRRGPRHDNDHVDIPNIKILPTTDEILCLRAPYMPKKDPRASHRYPCGQARLLDIHFRLQRYDSIELIIDSCYHASQRLVQLRSEPKTADYDDRMTTPKGFRYSLFRDVAFEEVSFDAKKSITIRVSFACPKALRGRRLGQSKHLEEGMLVALVGLDQDGCLSTTFMEIMYRQSTEAMRPRTGNDLRGKSPARVPNTPISKYSTSQILHLSNTPLLKNFMCQTLTCQTLHISNTPLISVASVVLSFAEPTGMDGVRRLLYNSQSFLEESFVLVELPSALYAGFYWTLKQLQEQSRSDATLAFLSSIAPGDANTSPGVSLPAYAMDEGFAFQLDPLRKPTAEHRPSLTLDVNGIVSYDTADPDFVNTLCAETTLDRGQASALYQNLCRGFAFTQGPPGTGKTFVDCHLL